MLYFRSRVIIMGKDVSFYMVSRKLEADSFWGGNLTDYLANI